MEIIPTLGIKYDFVFLDPPYFDWKTGEKKPDHDKLATLIDAVTHVNSVVCLCGTIPQLLEDYHYWARYFRVLFEIVQVKNTPNIKGYPLIAPLRTHENLFFMIKKNAKATNTHLDLHRTARPHNITSRYLTHDSINAHKNRQVKTGMNYLKDYVFTKQINGKNDEYLGHPTQKPISFITKIIQLCTEKEDYVLDPFGGSGTTAAVCKTLNRHCDIIELNQKYIQIIRARLSIKTMQDWCGRVEDDRVVIEIGS